LSTDLGGFLWEGFIDQCDFRSVKAPKNVFLGEMLTLVVAHTELKCVVGRANEAFRTSINDVCPYPTRKMLWDPFMDGEVQFVTVYGPEYVPWMAVAGIVTGIVCGSLLWCLIKKVLLKP
jgi:hypothetical protein